LCGIRIRQHDVDTGATQNDAATHQGGTMMYSKILVPIDTSYETDYWLKAPLREAWELAEKPDGTIHVMSVIPRNLLEGYYPDLYSEEVAAETKKKLDEIVEKHCPAGANVVTSLEEGGICPEILRVARELSVDVIVMASHGPLIKDYILGSNAAHVALHAPCSVFVVREPH
jgi:nucleotide-binding universal stress UspA family protein